MRAGLNRQRERAQLFAILSTGAGLAGAGAALLAAWPVSVIAEHGISASVFDYLAFWLPDMVARPGAWFGSGGPYHTWLAQSLAATGAPPAALLGVPAAGAGCAFWAWRSSGPHSFAATSHGAARFAGRNDLKRAGLLSPSGFVLGRWGRSLIRHKETLSVAILSPPGTGKTVQIISHILADHPDRAKIPGPSMIINDPKGEIYAATAGWRSSLGPVYHIRWTELEGVSWNPLSPRNLPGGREAGVLRAALLAELGEIYASPALALSQMLVLLRDHNATWRATLRDAPDFAGPLAGGRGTAAITEPLLDRVVRLQTLLAEREQYVDRLTAVAVPENVGQHWMVSGRAALAGFLLYEMATADRRAFEPSIGHMLDWLASGADPDENEEDDASGSDLTGTLLDAAIADAVANGDPARVAAELRSLRIKPDKERGSVISTAIGKLNIFRNVAIRSRTSRSDLSFDDLRGVGGRPVTVYFDIPLEDAEALGIPTGMFLQGAAAYLISQEEKVARTRPVQFILDEFWTLPKLDAITQVPALGRGQWVQLAIAGQSYAQIAAKLGNDALKILQSAMAWKLFFSQNDLDTAKLASEMIGHRTIESRSSSRTHGIGAAVADGWRTNVQRSAQGQPLIRPEEMMSLQKLDPDRRVWGELVLLVQGMQNTPIGGPGRPCRPVIWFRDRKLRRRARYRGRGFVDGPRGVAVKPWAFTEQTPEKPKPTSLAEFASRHRAP